MLLDKDFVDFFNRPNLIEMVTFFLFPKLWSVETNPDLPQELEVMKKILKEHLRCIPNIIIMIHKTDIQKWLGIMTSTA